MKEFFDIVVWVGFAYILFIFIRGMNETQVEKHKNKLDKNKKNLEE
ncbi:MAG: hypothetical protein U9Q30_08155 [Campylobacterota bacterium]|nr:hypothetical protein [Campylobacterota bacterium]